MAKLIYQGANLNFAYDTFAGLVNKVNQLIYETGYTTLTANQSGSVDVTTGNAYVNGQFGATTIYVSNTIFGGAVGAMANLVVSSALSVANSVYISNTLTVSTISANNINVTSNVAFSFISSLNANLTYSYSNTAVINYMYVGNSSYNIVSNTGGLVFNSNGISGSVNATNYSGTSNNSLYLGGVSAANIQVAIASAYSNAIPNDSGAISPSSTGFRGIPINSQSNTYTIALTDLGKQISTNSAVVVPNVATLALQTGFVAMIYNNGSSNITISTTDTMYLAGTSNTGTRTLLQNGLATINKVAGSTWIISGAGLL